MYRHLPSKILPILKFPSYPYIRIILPYIPYLLYLQYLLFPQSIYAVEMIHLVDMNQQEYELTTAAEQQQKQFSHSVKLEETAKGVRISAHVYADTAEHARQEALKVYLGIVHDLQGHDVKLAPMNATAVTNGVKE